MPKGSRPKVQRLTNAEYLALASFRRSIREFLSFSEDAAKEMGLTAQQHQAILAIRGLSPNGNMSVGDLAKQLMIQHHSAVELINRLEQGSLIERLPVEGDRRKVDVRLTSKAHDLLEQLSSAHITELKRRGPELARILQGFSEVDMASN